MSLTISVKPFLVYKYFGQYAFVDKNSTLVMPLNHIVEISKSNLQVK